MKISKEMLESSFPYLAIIDFNGVEYLGIILNKDKYSLSFIDLGVISDKKDLENLLKITQNWWWYSNRCIPVNLYYYEDVLPYMGYVKSFPAKTSNVIAGHVCSMEKLIDRKFYRKNRSLTIRDNV